LLTAHGGEDVLVIEQNYNIVEQAKGGVQAKDVRQKMYLSKDRICIDEFGGKDASKPTESILLDFAERRIVNLNHETKTKVTEDFDTRRKRIEKRRKNAEEDLALQPPGPQRDRLIKLYRPMLDQKRRFALDPNPGDDKTLLAAKCRHVKVIAEEEPGYVPFDGYFHPDLDLPHDNADVLFLLQIIGEKMADFIRKNRDAFKRVPMELHLDLAAGGTVDSRVTAIEKLDLAAVERAPRGGLGGPFAVPADYNEQARHLPVRPDKKADRPD
jgi:hypothetical protein